MTEDWKSVLGWEGMYEVSSLGRVRSLDRTVKNGNGSRLSRGRVLTPKDNSTGYKYVRFYSAVDNRAEPRYIHRLVSEAFLGECPEELVVDHIDSDKSNNSVANLRYISQSANSKRAVNHIVGKPKLTKDEVRMIRHLRAIYKTTYKDLAELFSVSVRAIQKICKRENYPNII